MRAHHTPTRRGPNWLLHGVLASLLVACGGGDESGLANRSEPLAPTPLAAASAAATAKNPNLPVYLVPYGRTVLYGQLTTSHQRRVDQAVAALVARGGSSPTDCVSGWDSGGNWFASCTANGYTCTIAHDAKRGHTTDCSKDE